VFERAAPATTNLRRVFAIFLAVTAVRMFYALFS
jgi:hypothetical protein